MEGQKGLFAFSDAIPFLLFDQEDENARSDLLPCQHCLVGSGLVCSVWSVCLDLLAIRATPPTTAPMMAWFWGERFPPSLDPSEASSRPFKLMFLVERTL